MESNNDNVYNFDNSLDQQSNRNLGHSIQTTSWKLEEDQNPSCTCRIHIWFLFLCLGPLFLYVDQKNQIETLYMRKKIDGYI